MNQNPRFLAVSKAFARGAAVFVMAIATLVLIGWAFQVETFKSGFGDITMKGNAAMCLLLSGAGLLLVTAFPRSLRWVGQICAAVVTLIGGLTLSQHIFGWNLGIDQLLFSEPPGALATASPGRMGPPASTCFTLTGIALFLLHRNRRIPSAQILSVIVVLASMLAIFGYSYRAEELYGVARYTGIAVHTAVALFVLGLGLLGVRADEGFVSIIAGDDSGGAMARRLLLPAIAIPFLIGLGRLFGQLAGYYDLGFGLAIYSLSIIALFTFFILRTAFKVSTIEQRRLSTELALRATEDRFHFAIKHAPVIIFNQDLDLRYRWVHAPAFGLPEEEILGKRDSDLFLTSDAEALINIKQRVLQTGAGAHEEVKLHYSGTTHFYDLTVEALRNPSARIIGVTCAAIDITQRKKTEQSLRESQRELQQALAAAEEASGLKDQFLATVSHELRTPLNAILGWAHMLQAQSLHPHVTPSAIRAIYESAKSQAQIIDDLLDVARIISGKMTLQPRVVNLSDILSASLATVAHASNTKNIQTLLQFEKGSENISLFADEQRLQQIFWNLISNAVKFTPTGGKIEIGVETTSTEVIITVRDTGIGISQEFLPLVFERFRQADSSTTRKFGGLGLGLSITKNLVELHGGTVSVRSDGKDAGSTFMVRLPLFDNHHRIEPSHAGMVHQPIYDTKLAGTRILLVDDDEKTLHLIGEAFQNAEAEFLPSNSAKEALEMIKRWVPDLLISDIAMPDNDGYWLIGQLRSLPAPTNRIPAIALTAFASTSDRSRILTAGFQMFVSKPVNPADLLATVKTLLESQSSKSNNASVSNLMPQMKGISILKGKKVLMIEDDLLSTEVLRLALEDHGVEFRSAAAASKAMEVLAEWLPDIVISDLGLPDEDGYALIKKIRALPSVENAGIPAVALTGYGKEEGARAIAAGFQFYKSKPVEPDVLISLLKELLN